MRALKLALLTTALATVVFGYQAEALLGFGGRDNCSSGEFSKMACLARVPSSPVARRNGWLATPTGCSSDHLHQVFHGSRGRKTVALTFDDGPSRYTSRLLHSLAKRDIAGTFFVIGTNIPGREPLVRGVLREGSTLGNHTYSHRLTYSWKPLHSDLKRTNQMIKKATGFKPCLFRAPYGLIQGPLLKVARMLGLATIQWDVDPQDWRQPGVDSIVSNILGNARNGSIILMHETAQTAEALPAVIRGLRTRGFKFATVEELLKLKMEEEK